MSAPWTIYPAATKDVAAVMAIAAASATSSHWSREHYEAMVAARPDAPVGRVLLVAKEAGQVLGFAVASAPAVLVPREAELENLAVAAGAQGQGIGTALVSAVLQWAAEPGSGVARLEVRAGNARAIRLYQRLGFALAGVRRGYYRDPQEDAVCMQCAVP